MKLVVFAHTPPPHHGQSYMVQLMVDGLGTDNQTGICCHHINARLSDRYEDIGRFQLVKIFRLFGFCLQAIWCRLRHGVKTFYYIPGPGKHFAVARDWLAMFLCRPFFPRLVLHWHAAGLAEWLEQPDQKSWRWLTHALMKNADLSIVLSEYNRTDAEYFNAKRIRVIGNGIPDPCPDFDGTLASRRQARLAARMKLAAGEKLSEEEITQAGGDPQIINVLFVGHCTREKGLLDAINGVLRTNEKLAASHSPLSFRLTAAGEAAAAGEETELENIFNTPAAAQAVRRTGFLADEAKRRAFSEADVFCFPTYYAAESFGLVAIEAMAYGLPVVTTRWRSLPEIFPAGYAGLVDVRSPEQVGEALLKLALTDDGVHLRGHFLEKFTLNTHLARLAGAFRELDGGESPG